MTEVRRFSEQGVWNARLFLLNEVLDDDPTALTSDVSVTEPVPEVASITKRSFLDRRDAGEYLYDLLLPLEASGADPAQDVGLWTWLSLHWMDQLAPNDDSGTRRTGDLARWIPSTDSHQKYYRHLLAGPWRIYRAHRDDPDIAMAILATKVHAPGELVEQFASRQEIVSDRSLLEAITRLYYDSRHREIRRGATRKGPGGARRLADLLYQLDVTFDIHAMTADQILELLPSEFDEFRR